MKTIKKNCLNCFKEFNSPLKEIKRGNGKLCSISCSNNFRKGVRKVIPNVVCRMCNTSFYKIKSSQKLSRTGLFFCTRKCKDMAQRLESGVHELNESRINASKLRSKRESREYSAIAKRNHPLRCNKCQYDKIIQVLEVHHKDRNRKNNNVENLEILCPTCHQEEHFINKDGRFNKLKQKKT
jgi:Zn finger protein HypA/HybF involved in hydrogenase expression